MTFAVDWALNLIVFFSLRYDLSSCLWFSFYGVTFLVVDWVLNLTVFFSLRYDLSGC